MRHLLTTTLLILTLSIHFSCKKNDPEPEPDPCTKIWTKLNPQNMDLDVADGKLHLSSTDSIAAWSPVSLYQDSLQGDFSVSMNYEGFASGSSGAGSFMQMVITNGTLPFANMATAGTGNVTPSGGGLQIGVHVDSASVKTIASDFQNTSSNSGSLTISRSGSLLTLTAQSGGVTASANSIQFNAQPLRIGIQFGSNYETVYGVSGVYINDFTVTESGMLVKPDAFDCNSIKE